MGTRTCGLHAIVVVCVLVYVCGKCDPINYIAAQNIIQRGLF